MRSFLRRPFSRPSDARKHGPSQDEGSNNHDMRHVAPPTANYGMEVSAAVSSPRTPGRSSRQINIDASPVRILEPVPADRQWINISARLWDWAYDEIKKEEPVLVDAYEKILSCQLQGGFGSELHESQLNIIADDNPARRCNQMTQLVEESLNKIVKEPNPEINLTIAVDAVQSAKHDIRSAIQAMPQAAVALAGLCVILDVLETPMNATGKNNNGIYHVVKKMDWYWRLSQKIFHDTANRYSQPMGITNQLESYIIRLYKAFLSYQIKGVCSYNRHFLRDLFQLDSWKGDFSEIREAENCLRQKAKVFFSEEMNSNMKMLLETQRLEIVRKCIKDLRLTDPNDDKMRLEQTKGGLLHDSYNWILENPVFRQWFGDGAARILWIKGDPGKGKTMLLCGIIDELQPTAIPTTLFLGWTARKSLTYFFCQATDANLNSASAVLRGLIYLLIKQQPTLISHLQKRCKDAGRNIFRDANQWAVLSEVLSSILNEPFLQTTYLIIDALDECVVDLPKLLDFIVQASLRPIRAKWVVSSRNSAEIERKLGSINSQISFSLDLRDNAEQVSHAVDNYIDAQVSRLKSLQNDEGLREHVQETLREKASGTFLWVSLVVQQLKGAEIQQIKKVLRDMPVGLEELYTQMMSNIERLDKDDRELCKLLLSAVMLARRPLSILELGIVSGLPDNISHSVDRILAVVGTCGSFLTVQDAEVFIVHQSAMDYFNNNATTFIFPKQRLEGHRNVFQRLLHAMRKSLHRNMYDLESPGVTIDQVSIPTPDPLAAVRYACIYWVDHLDAYTSNIAVADAQCGNELQHGGIVDKFLREMYLYWLEGLSLVGGIPQGAYAMQKLEKLMQKTENSELTDLVLDMHRFFLAYREILETTPLQVYVSALIFSPARSAVRQLFKAEEPCWITVRSAKEEGWDACQRTLEGHTGWVDSVAFSPDGRQIVSGSGDTTIKVWDMASGTCTHTLANHIGLVFSVAISPNGQYIASGSGDDTVMIWDMVSGIHKQTLEGHCSSVSSVAISPDSQHIASGSGDNTIKIWDAASGMHLRTLKGDGSSALSVAYSPDGRQIVSGSGDNTIRVWDTGSGICINTLEGHSGSVLSVSLSPNGRWITSGSVDNTIKIWDAFSGECTQTLKGHSSSAISVVFSLDGRQIASCSGDNTVKIWDIASGTCIQTFEGHSSLVCSVVFSSDGQRVASGSRDKTIKIWGVPSGTQRLDGHSGSVLSVSFSPDGRQIASGANDETIQIRDAASGICMRILKGHSSLVRSVWDWSLDQGVQTQKHYSHSKSVGSVSRATASPDTQQQLCISSDMSWVILAGQNVLWLPPSYRPSNVDAVVSRGRVMAIGRTSGQVLILSFSRDKAG